MQRRFLSLSAFLLFLPAVAVAQSVEGAWRPVEYHLKGGGSRDVDGLILFTPGHWSVLFFTLEDGAPTGGSAEAGTWRVHRDQLTFFHTLRLADTARGAGTPLVRELRQTPTSEPTRLEFAESRMTIHFPSGNRMVFERLPSE